MLDYFAPPKGHRPMLPRIVNLLDLNKPTPVGAMDNIRSSLGLVPVVRGGLRSLFRLGSTKN